MKMDEHNMKLKRTKQPVTPIAFAIVAPERLRRLTWCYVDFGKAVQ